MQKIYIALIVQSSEKLKTCRTVFAYHWIRIKASPAVLEKNKLSLGRNSYNKSLAHAKWLVAACHRALNHVEQNGTLTS